jgi:tetratricopeptide (TPR) repeat protein
MKTYLRPFLLSTAFAVAACGGTKTPETSNTVKPNGEVVPTNESGGEVGVPDQQANVSGEAKASYQRGWAAWLSGDLPAAKKGFEEAASKDENNPAPRYSLGVVLERLGDSAGAQSAFRAAFTAKADYEIALGAYAFSLAGKGALNEAATFLEDRAIKAPTSFRIKTYLAEIKSLQGDHSTAQTTAQDALRLNPNFDEAMVTIARDHWRARKLELGRYALQAILDGFGEGAPARDADNAEAALVRGLLERDYGRRAVAMTAFELAAKKRPDMAEALVGLGAMKLEAGNASEAQPVLESAVKFAPKSSVAHLNLGDCYRLVGRPADAKREFDTALDLDASLAAVHYDVGLLYLFTPNVAGMTPAGQIDAAIAEFEKYKGMKSAKQGVDDVDDLITRAKAKQAELKALASAPPEPTPAAPASAAPSATPSAAPSAAPTTK